MKILLVSEYFPPKIMGGGEISAQILANELAKKNIEVHVLTSYFKGLESFEEKNEVKSHRCLKTGHDPSSFIENIKRMTIFNRSVEKETTKLDSIEKFDVIHALNTTSTLGVSKIKTNAKLFATINSYTGICPKRNLFYQEKEVCTGCNYAKYLRCIAKSKYIAKQKLNPTLKYNPAFLGIIYNDYIKRKKALKKFHLITVSDFVSDVVKNKSNVISKIYNMVNIENNIIEYSEIKPIKGTIISHIGSLEKFKGADILLKSYAKIKDKKDSLLLIVGEGSQKPNLKELAAMLGINNRTHFVGKVDYKYIPYIYHKSDIITLFSLWPEPLSRILLESTYFGKPIIATDVGGNSEGIINGESGFLSNDLNIISQKMGHLINNKELRERFGNNSKKVFAKKFKKERIIEQIINLYS